MLKVVIFRISHTMETEHLELHWITQQRTHDFFADDTQLPGTEHNKGVGTFVQVVQGPGVDQRVGNNIMVKAIELRGSISLPNVATPSADFPNWDRVRIIVFEDEQFNLNTGGNTTGKMMTAIGDDEEADPSLIPTNAFYNPDGFDRFNIMSDKVYTLNYAMRTADNALGGVVTHVADKMHTHSRIKYIAKDGSANKIMSRNLSYRIFSETKIARVHLFVRVYFEN